ncbi:hypothetical protein DLJ53_22090 [Acuticoccus sediminis]|uniref:Blue-light-activated histidine kinase n=1 Tax=Acuticoccus sediminis TaxID=2184697 RepID=A0A8B2NUB3_9HYPH|nr:chemotaxis protein CheB [Acuticoccus sediminis]RAH99236.1 hypothetical protein DLJ53_22090 [Acuticoccus sediminis]
MDAEVRDIPQHGRTMVPVVAIGASVGAADALCELLGAIPRSTGACYVVVGHLDPGDDGTTRERIVRSTDLPVRSAESGTVPRADTVVMVEEDAALTLSGGRFRLAERTLQSAPIDTLFAAVASELGEKGIAIVLSGTSHDGSQGLRLVKAAGGYVIAQSPDSAADAAMPSHAIATGLVDKVLLPREMPGAVVDYLAILAGATAPGRGPEPDGRAGRYGARPRRSEVIADAHAVLVNEMAPAYVVVGPTRELVHSGGPVADYLEAQPGSASLELVNLMRDDLRIDLRLIWHSLMSGEEQAVRDRVGYRDGERLRLVRISGRRLTHEEGGEPHYLFVFQDQGEVTPAPPAEPAAEEIRETAADAPERSREELQSVNFELAHKIDELRRTNNDLANLLASTNIATLFLDTSGRVRGFTPVARRTFDLDDADIGRLIGDLCDHLEDTDLTAEVAAVVVSAEVTEKVVELRDGSATFLMRLVPYRTASGIIDGVVITFVDVSGFKRAQARIDVLNTELEGQVAALEAILDIAPIAIAFSDQPISRMRLNSYGQKMLGLGAETGPPRSELGQYAILQNGRELTLDELPSTIVWRTGEIVEDVQARYVGPGGTFDVLISAAPILNRAGETTRVVAVMRDISALTSARAIAEQRAEQQAYVARLGGRSLSGLTADEIIAELPDRLAVLLKCEYAKVLRLQPDRKRLELISSHGFGSPLGTVVDGGLDSQAGYTLTVHEPVVVTDLRTETRFSGPALLRIEGIISGMSVIVGSPDEPFGVIGVHSRGQRTFTQRDAAFLQSVANILAASLRRDEADRQKRLLLDELRHRVKNMLATMQSVIHLSLRDSNATTELGEQLTQRVRALALAHDINFRRADSAVSLRDLIRVQTQAYDPDNARIVIDGDCTVPLPPGIAIDTSMVVHELVTNAVKHGAMAQDGAVSIAIGCDTEDGICVVHFVWQETGPKPVGAVREGAGSRLMRAIASRRQFDIKRRFTEEGMRCEMTITFDVAANDAMTPLG